MANERPSFVVAETHSPIDFLPFLLLETLYTSDGYRTRVCDGRWETLDEAEAKRQRRIRGRS